MSRRERLVHRVVAQLGGVVARQLLAHRERGLAPAAPAEPERADRLALLARRTDARRWSRPRRRRRSARARRAPSAARPRDRSPVRAARRAVEYFAAGEYATTPPWKHALAPSAIASAAATAPAVQDSATASCASRDQARSTARWASAAIGSGDRRARRGDLESVATWGAAVNVIGTDLQLLVRPR